MKKRSSEILKQLATGSEGEIYLEELCGRYKVSEKTIRKDFEDINFYLKEKGIPRIKISQDGRIELFPAKWDKDILEALKHIDNLSYVMNKEERKTYIMVCLLKQREYMTMEQLAELLCVTRITVLNDMIDVTRSFQEAGIEIKSKPGRGLKLLGGAYEKRVLLARILRENNFEAEQEFGLSNSFFYKLLEEICQDYPLETVNRALKSAEKKLDIHFTGRGFRKMLFYLYAALNLGEYEPESGGGTVEKGASGKDAEETAEDIEIAAGILREVCEEERFRLSDEVGWLSRFMQENRVLMKPDGNAGLAEIQSMVANFLYHVSEDLGITLYDDYALFEFVSVHLKQMAERIKNEETPIINPVLEEIKQQYPLVYESVRKNLHIIESFYSIQISEQEMSYIVMHLCADIERRSNDGRQLTTMIIAPESIASGRFLKAQLEKYFSFDIKKIVTINHLAEEEETDVDFIISTVVLPKKEVPVLVLQPMLDFEAFNRIQLMVFRILQSGILKANSELQEQIDAHDFRLYQTTTPHLMHLHFACDDCNEALREGGDLLVRQEYAWPGFTEALIHSLEVNGPYFVMRRGVAVAHTVSPENQYESAVSLVTIPEGVEFGHEYHDPVYVLFCMNIRDSHSYVKVLNDILKIAGKKDFLDRILAATDCGQAYELICRMCLE